MFLELPDFNPYNYDNSNGYELWTGADGMYSVSSMKESHLINAIRFCKVLASSATYESDAEIWYEWIEVFEKELRRRPKETKVNKPKKRKMPNVKQFVLKELEKYPEKKYHDMYCEVCSERYTARTADLKRGWGINHTKSCTTYRKMWKKEGSYYPRNKFVTELDNGL